MSVLSPPKLGASKCIFSIVWTVALVLQATSLAHAQCPTAAWQPGLGVPGTNGSVYAMTHWDPDGAGPAVPIVVIGGEFTLAGSASVSNIAAFDPATGTWSSLGSGFNGAVFSLTALPNAELIAGGVFTRAGPVLANRIARWNGTNWTPLGAGIGDTINNAGVFSLTTLPNGNLIAGGYFHRAGSVFVANIARWNGTSWSAMANGLGNAGNYGSSVFSLLTLANGDLIAGGGFQGSSLNYMPNIARWNGTTWTGFGAAPEYLGWISSLAQLANGDIVAGFFGSATTPDLTQVLRWNGTSWSALGTMEFGNVDALAVLPNGELIAGGCYNLFSWNGDAWTSIGPVLDEYGDSGCVNALKVLPNGDLFVGGGFRSVNATGVSNIAQRTYENWSPLTPGTDAGVFALGTNLNGEVLAGGGFSTINGSSSNSIAKGNGSDWSPLGAGVSGSYKLVYATTTTNSGDMIIGGSFFTAGNVSAMNVARWNGHEWFAMGSGLGSNAAYVRALASLPNGQLVAGGDFHSSGWVTTGSVAVWDGANWSPLGGGFYGSVSGRVNALASAPSGLLYAGGDITSAGGNPASRIARWNGANWSVLGSGLNATVRAIGVMANGDVIAAGDFTEAGGASASHIAIWNGLAWTSLGLGVDGNVFALAVHPNGDVIVGGSFTMAGGLPANRIARWNGLTWTTLGSGVDGPVFSLAALPNGDIFVGGTFLFADGNPSAYLARYQIAGWPVFTQQPSPAQTCLFRNAVLAVAATGSEPISYQWQLKGLVAPYAWANLNDGPISSAGQPIGIAGGAHTSVLAIIAAIDHSDNIDAEFRCVVLNACGTATSDTAPLYVWPVGTGDANGNETLDGQDIPEFVNILLTGSSPGLGSCAVDMDFSGTVDAADVPHFIAALLIGS